MRENSVPVNAYLKFDHARVLDSSALEVMEALYVRGLSENYDTLLRRKDGRGIVLPLEEFESA